MRHAFLAVMVALLCAGMAQAGPILINSGNGVTSWEALVDLSYGSFTAVTGATGTAVPITPHPAWDPTGDWISYARTGWGDPILAPTHNTPIVDPDPQDQRQAIVSFTRTFEGGAGVILNMKLWADDTAFMRVDGGAWIPTSHPWAQSTCETYPTSCQASKFSQGSFTLGSTGTHTLEILAYQIGDGTSTSDNPFGIKYSGELAPVPEPATLFLLGSGIVGLGLRRRRSS